MFGALKRYFAATRVVQATVVSLERSDDRQRYTVFFQEIGNMRTYKTSFAWYGYDGRSTPRPRPGETASLRVNRCGRVVYAGAAD